MSDHPHPQSDPRGPERLTDPRPLDPSGVSYLPGTDLVYVDLVNRVIVDGLGLDVAEADIHGPDCPNPECHETEPITLLTVRGLICGSGQRANVGYILDDKGVATIITRLLALANRGDSHTLMDLGRQLFALHQDEGADLRRLRNLLGVVLDAIDSPPEETHP